MDTKKRNYSSIVNGPSAQRMLMNFSLWGEITSHNLSYNLVFSLEDGKKMICTRIISLEHEDGSDYCFNVVGDVLILDRHEIVKLILPATKFFYSTKTRTGAIASEDELLLFDGADKKCAMNETEADFAFNPS